MRVYDLQLLVNKHTHTRRLLSVQQSPQSFIYMCSCVFNNQPADCLPPVQKERWHTHTRTQTYSRAVLCASISRIVATIASMLLSPRSGQSSTVSRIRETQSHSPARDLHAVYVPRLLHCIKRVDFGVCGIISSLVATSECMWARVQVTIKCVISPIAIVVV